MTRTYEIDPIVSSEYSLIARTKEIQTSYSPEGYRAGYKNSPYGEYILSAQLDLFVITTKENVEFHSENLSSI